MLVVLGIMAMIMAMAGPAFKALSGAGGENRASSELSGLLELSRLHAITHQTYVRVGIGQSSSKQTVVLSIYSADGTLDTDTGDQKRWPLLKKPLVFDRLEVNDALDVTGKNGSFSTTSDLLPSSTDIEPFRRKMSGASSELDFKSIIQFDPHGNAQIKNGTTARFIKIGFERAGDKKKSNPFIIRISGTTGLVSVYRKEDGI